MLRTLRGILFLLAIADPICLPAQEAPKRIDHGTTSPDLKGYTTPGGFKLEVVATPALNNPVLLGFTSSGEPFVLEQAAGKAEVKPEAVTITYKDGSTRKIAVTRRPGADTLRLLTATKENGPWDQAREIHKTEGIDAALVIGDAVYLATPGLIERISLSKPEGKEKRQVIARGFGHAPGGVTGLRMGPDGWLYLAVAAGDHHAEGSDGSKATVLGTGAILRCKPEGGLLQVVAQGLAHPTTPTWDSVEHAFLADREERGGRVLHLLDGNDHGYTLSTGRTSPLSEAQRKELFDPLRAAAPALLRAGGSAPTAVLSPIEVHFPGQYRAGVLVADPARQAIAALSLTSEGATFAVDQSFDLVHSSDKSFSPRGLSVGPDGALYILDGQAKGRLLRLSWTGTAEEEGLPLRPLDSWQKLLKGSEEDLLAALNTPEASDRRLAGEELARRGEKNRAALVKLALNDDESVLARLAAWSGALNLWNDEVQKAALVLAAGRDDDLRRVGASALGLRVPAADAATHEVLLKQLNDGIPTVRRAVAVAMGQVGADGAADALVNTLMFDEGRDPAFLAGLVHAIELLGKRGVDRLLNVGDSGVDAEIARIVFTFTGLRTRPALDALPKLLVNPHLNSRQRSTLLRTLPQYRLDPAPGFELIPAHFEAMPDEPDAVKLAALEGLCLAREVRITPKLASWLTALLRQKEAGLNLASLRTLASVDRAAAKASLANLPEETRTQLLAELKKSPEGMALLRDLEK